MSTFIAASVALERWNLGSSRRRLNHLRLSQFSSLLNLSISRSLHLAVQFRGFTSMHRSPQHWALSQEPSELTGAVTEPRRSSELPNLALVSSHSPPRDDCVGVCCPLAYHSQKLADPLNTLVAPRDRPHSKEPAKDRFSFRALQRPEVSG